MIPREEIIEYARELAAQFGLDPDAFIQQLSQPMGAIAQYEQNGDATALLNAMRDLAASGNTVQQRTTADPTATPTPATGDGTAQGTRDTSDIPFEETPAGQGTFTPSATTPAPATATGSGPTPASGATNPFQNPSPDVVDPSIAAAARQPRNIPAAGMGNPMAQPTGVARGVEGVRAAPFGSISLDQMNPYERNFFFPFFDDSLGGASQASRNLAMQMGLSPQSGNPWSRYLEGVMEPLANQASILALLNGQTDDMGFVDMGAVVPMVQQAIQQGKSSVFGEGGAGDVIGKLKQLAVDAAAGNLSDNLGLARQQMAMRDPGYVMRLIEDMVGSTVSPYQRRQLRPVLQEQMGGYYREAPSNPQLGPFQYLVGQMGY